MDSKTARAFVLSGSSLIVRSNQVILKTCGPTSLLSALEPVMEMAGKQANLSNIMFTRGLVASSNRQPSPHRSFADEVRFLDRKYDGQSIAIDNGFHMWTMSPTPCSTVFEVVMRDLPQDVMKASAYEFKFSPSRGGDRWVEYLVPGARVNGQWFQPRGYICNAFAGNDDHMFTIHIAQQTSCSYVTFESNFIDKGMLERVVQFFRPGTLTIVTIPGTETMANDFAAGGYAGRHASMLLPKVDALLTTAMMLMMNESVPPDIPFEGAEKRLEITFEPGSTDLLAIPQQTWSDILSHANCAIMSVMDSPTTRAFVLSESSLFVRSNQVVLKTCGTTSLLYVVQPILIAAGTRAVLINILFTRGLIMSPALQPSPHRSFAEEVAFLQMEFDGQPVAIHNEFHMWATAPSSCSTMFEVAMRDLPRDVMAKFYYDFKGCESWVQDLVPGARVDSQWFEPCGYSCNAFVGKTDRLFTIHITPQPSCSYVSFESNFVDMDMMARVIRFFRPGKLTIATINGPGMMSVVAEGCDGGHDPGSRIEEPDDIDLEGYACTFAAHLAHVDFQSFHLCV
ncbi:Adenosylmethionine decarboxylase [Plasmodiophora brassicae]